METGSTIGSPFPPLSDSIIWSYWERCVILLRYFPHRNFPDGSAPIEDSFLAVMDGERERERGGGEGKEEEEGRRRDSRIISDDFPQIDIRHVIEWGNLPRGSCRSASIRVSSTTHSQTHETRICKFGMSIIGSAKTRYNLTAAKKMAIRSARALIDWRDSNGNIRIQRVQCFRVGGAINDDREKPYSWLLRCRNARKTRKAHGCYA